MVDVYFDDTSKRFRVGCGRCGCSSGIDPRDKSEAPAIARWNRRAQPPQPTDPEATEYEYRRLSDAVQRWAPFIFDDTLTEQQRDAIAVGRPQPTDDVKELPTEDMETVNTAQIWTVLLRRHGDPNWRNLCKKLLGVIDRLNSRLAASAKDEDETYEIGKRDGYESAIQDLDVATGGDGEFFGSTAPGQTVDVPAMKRRIIERCTAEADAWNDALEAAAAIFDKRAEANISTSSWFVGNDLQTISARLPSGEAKPANGPAIAYLANRDHAHAIRALRRAALSTEAGGK
jgi:hypothetical protein